MMTRIVGAAALLGIAPHFHGNIPEDHRADPDQLLPKPRLMAGNPTWSLRSDNSVGEELRRQCWLLLMSPDLPRLL